MKKAKGITLVALIITIVVLLIIAAVTINAVSGEKIIEHADNAAAEFERASTEENAMIGNIVSGMYDYARQSKYGIQNAYGFYFNREYKYVYTNEYDINHEKLINGYSTSTFYENGAILCILYEEVGFVEGSALHCYDMLGNEYFETESFSYNVPYTGTGTFNETYTLIVDNNGNVLERVEFPSGTATYSENTAAIGNDITLTFSNEGQTLISNGKTYILQ